MAQYTYDALDRRVKVVVGATTRGTLYDGSAAILDFNGSGTQTARYLQGTAIDEILAREVSGTTSWYMPDRLGTIRDISDNTGAVIDHIDYNAFGTVKAESAPSAGDRWKYTGRELDTETGLYQYRARYYDSAAGRFVGQDRTGYSAGDTNLYRFVGNFAQNANDPLGDEIVTVEYNAFISSKLAGGPWYTERLSGNTISS